jgi:hypothetical protein
MNSIQRHGIAMLDSLSFPEVKLVDRSLQAYGSDDHLPLRRVEQP